MESSKPQNMNHVIRKTFYDMTLYLQTIFMLYGIKDFLADDIISCLEDGYGKALQGLNKLEGKPGKSSRIGINPLKKYLCNLLITHRNKRILSPGNAKLTYCR